MYVINFYALNSVNLSVVSLFQQAQWNLQKTEKKVPFTSAAI